MVGEVVHSLQQVLIKHCHTAHWLATDNFNFQNIYGNESEVFTHSYQNPSKSQNLISELEGRSTIDIPLRRQQEQNTWVLRTAQHPSEDFDESLAVNLVLF